LNRKRLAQRPYTSLKLPKTPYVIVRGNCVVICYKDGSETVWGDEETHIEALNLARELEIELRAVNYIKIQIKIFISEMMELLDSINADEDLLLSIIKDGHSFAFRDLESSTRNVLKLDSKQEIKKIVMEKLETSYIV
jgi:hypothetical protein